MPAISDHNILPDMGRMTRRVLRHRGAAHNPNDTITIGDDAVKGRSPKHHSMRRRQSQRAPGIREQPRPKADKDRSGFFAAQIYIEPHFAGRKSLV
jgi:hypothetical protein